MRRIWMPLTDIHEHGFELTGDAFHHAIQVSRFRVGEEFEVVCGGPEAFQVRLESIGKKSASVKVVGRRTLPVMPRPYIHLAFAVSKWPIFEEVLEKSVELGVRSVQPLLTEFSFIRKKSDWPDARQARLQKIIQSATEQSGRSDLLELRPPLTLNDFTKSLKPAGTNPQTQAPCLFAYEGPSTHDIRSVLSPFKSDPPSEIWAVVGSEGGFSVDEVAFMAEAGWPPITLGAQVLRAETACFALVSVIKYELGLMRL